MWHFMQASLLRDMASGGRELREKGRTRYADEDCEEREWSQRGEKGREITAAAHDTHIPQLRIRRRADSV
jgi:hypothetical protein